MPQMEAIPQANVVIMAVGKWGVICTSKPICNSDFSLQNITSKLICHPTGGSCWVTLSFEVVTNYVLKLNRRSLYYWVNAYLILCMESEEEEVLLSRIQQ
jgi:hypothetical protein